MDIIYVIISNYGSIYEWIIIHINTLSYYCDYFC